jgi:dipeptidyl aminopeptidase/acylaminoacyl peptidase
VAARTLAHAVRADPQDVPGLGSLLRLASAVLALLAGVLPAAEGANPHSRIPGRLAVVQGGDDSRIKLMSADGSHATTLVPAAFGVGSPTWRPDGRALAFVTSSRAPGLFLVNDDGTDLRPLTKGGGGDPSFSRDGRFVAFTRSGDIFVARADGTRPRRRVKQGLENAQPTWSPDGKQIVFVRLTHEFGADLYLLNLATRTIRRLTTGSHDVSPGLVAAARVDRVRASGDHFRCRRALSHEGRWQRTPAACAPLQGRH